MLGIKCQRTISTQKLKLLGEALRYDLYYSLTSSYDIYQHKTKKNQILIQFRYQNYLRYPSTGSTRGSHDSYLSLYDLATREKLAVEFKQPALPCKLKPIPVKCALNNGTICEFHNRISKTILLKLHNIYSREIKSTGLEKNRLEQIQHLTRRPLLQMIALATTLAE